MALQIRSMMLGEGRLKTIVSLTGVKLDDIEAQARAAVSAGADCLEWRIDTFCATPVALEVSDLRTLRAALPDTPLLATVRSGAEGGSLACDSSEYHTLVAALIDSGVFDLIDIELCWPDEVVDDLMVRARDKHIAVVISHHDFDHTPEPEVIDSILIRMLDAGADVAKVAFMAQDASDCLSLMQAINRVKVDRPDALLLGIAMGRFGSLSRFAGEYFGSCATFCKVSGVSAPGQIDLQQTIEMAQFIHTLN